MCSVEVRFKPGGFGGFPASLSFTDDGAGSPQTVPMGGLGARDNAGHIYILDGYGSLHSDGGSPALVSAAYWSGWNIARSVALFPDGQGGYLMDGYGGLHEVGNATPVGGFAYWGGWDIARQVVLAPWSSKSRPAGWTLDGYGGVHSFGGAPAVSNFAYWGGWDIARGIVTWTGSGTGGWVLDGYGGIHPFGTAPGISGFAYWGGWDIATCLAGANFGSGIRRRT
jgi:hypothetical protein